jgi:Holliday junction DNA helicase RuvA
LIGALAGKILRKQPQEVLVDVGGVGYRVTIPISTFYRLGEAGSPVALRIHTHVREDALALYGFASETEEDLFSRLISVAGVGPKLAVNILSGIESKELLDALRHGDLHRLTRVPGVGKKTAERLILELKDKLPPKTAEEEERAPEPPSTPREDLISALGNLGYSRSEAERALDRAARDSDGRFEDLLRRALQVLSGR